MNGVVQLVSTFVGPVSMIMALVLMVSILQRKDRSQLKNSVLMGGLFSLTLILSMSDPIDLGAGGIHDLRGLLIGTAAALLGPAVGLMTLVAGLAMRLGIGGPGMYAGLVAMLGAFGGGLVWRYMIAPRDFAGWQKSVLLGGMISFHLGAMFMLPRELWSFLFTQMVPFYIVANLVGAFLINYLLGGELSFLSAAETSKIHANTDHLTGLLNRRGLDMIMPDLKAPVVPGRGRALLYFDIDKFKSTNDNFGHAIGDMVLKNVVERVSGNLRHHDVFARMGGDEFAVILPDVDVKEAQQIADRCRAVVAEETFQLGKANLPISISLGAIWLSQPTELDQMLLAADRALYQAKSNGRNAVVFLSNLRGNSMARRRPLAGAA